MKKARDLLLLPIHVINAFISNDTSQSAAALTYMTLFAVVPFLTVTYAAFSLIPAFAGLDEQLQLLIASYLLPDAGREVLDHLNTMSQQARSLTGFGIAFLAVTAFLMLKSIERALNAIWKVPQHRGGINGFLVYWGALSLGPLLIGSGLLVSTYLVSVSLLKERLSLQITTPLLHVLPLVLSTTTFTLIFFAVPNCKVPWKHALAGGIITAIAFEIAKKIFTLLITHSSYQVVYGAFAAIPLFLLWIYCCWLLLLCGAHVTHALSNIGTVSAADLPDAIAVLAVLERFHQAQIERKPLGDRAMTQQRWLFGQYRLSVAQWERLRALLLQHRWLIREDDGDYVLLTDLHALPLAHLFDAVPLQPAELPLRIDTQAQWPLTISTLLLEEYNRTRARLAMPVATLWQDKDQKNDDKKDS